MAARHMLLVLCALQLACLVLGGGHGGGHHKKVIIHVPYKVHHHHHKHTIIKHIHHKDAGGGDDHYEVLGYTYGEPKSAPHHFGGGHGWHSADEGSHDSPVSFEGGESSYGASASDGGEDHFSSNSDGSY